LEHCRKFIQKILNQTSRKTRKGKKKTRAAATARRKKKIRTSNS